MGFRSFWHKIKIGFERMREPSIPYISSAKRYGNLGEDKFENELRLYLPNCKIKKNVIIQTNEGNAEIDFLILYKNKLFAVEVKHWSGHITESNGNFYKVKYDKWTNETHTQTLKSPFKQLRHAIYLLRKQIPDNVWINDIVFFYDADSTKTEGDNFWFNDMFTLTTYIVNYGKTSRDDYASSFFKKVTAADYLYGKFGDGSLCGIVCNESLRFTTPNGILDRQNISYIYISHHWSYDELKITTRNGISHTINVENGAIYVIDNGYRSRYALSKLDFIQLAI